MNADRNPDAEKARAHIHFGQIFNPAQVWIGKIVLWMIARFL